MPPRPRLPRGFAPELRLVIDASDADAPLHTRLYRQLRAHILGRKLAAGTRLPSARALAHDLGISRNTVEAAVAQLVAEGFVTRHVGIGTLVATALTEQLPFAGKPRQTPATHQPRSRVALSARGRQLAALGIRELDGVHEIGACSTSLETFPHATWNRFLAQRARDADRELRRQGSPFGLRALREQIAEHVALVRGLRCHAEQVLVVSSAQQALDLCARLLLDPGDRVAVENPGYPSAAAVFAGHGAVVAPVPVDDQGLVVDALTKEPRVRVAYVTPSHQFPLGMTMSLARRLALLRWASSAGSLVIEDDYDSEFRYDGPTLAALHALDRDDRVLYVGTFNKVLFPGLRLAYLVLPRPLLRAFAGARRLTDGGSPPLLQATLADFMLSGHYARHVRAARRHYAACRDALIAGVRAHWGDHVVLGPSDTGLHVVAHLPRNLDDIAIAATAHEHALRVTPLSRYYARQPRRGLLLGFGAGSTTAVAESVAALAPALRPLGQRRCRR